MRAMMIHASPAWVLLAALVLDAVIGDPYALYRAVPHPVALIGRAIAVLDGAWNTPERSRRMRRVLGVLLLAVMVSGTFAIGLAITALVITSYSIHYTKLYDVHKIANATTGVNEGR